MAYIGNEPAEAYSNIAYQDFGTQSGTTFTLDYPAGAPGELEVFVNNVRQEPSVAYTVSGTTLTMTGTVAASDDFYVVFQGKAQQTVTHPANTALATTTGTFSGALSAGALSATTGTFSGAVSMGANNITFSNGNGIDFSATAGSGASSSILDDYEEGTWTPSIGGTATYNGQTGYYTRVGNIVLCIYDIRINAIGTGSTSIMTGFPFTAANLTSGPVSYYAGIATNVYSLDSYIINGSTNMYYTGHTTASGNIGNNLTVFQNSARIVGAVTYRV